MKVTTLHGLKPINVSIKKYLINWDRKVSTPQFHIKQILYPFWKTSCVLEEFVIKGSKYRIDLININSMIAIEVSPQSVHTEYNEFFHKSRSGFLKKINSDLEKERWCERNNIKLITLYDDDIKNFSHDYCLKTFGVYL